MLSPNSLLSVDCETTPMAASLAELPKNTRDSWEYYCRRNHPDVPYEESWLKQAALKAEYSIITCVSMCYYSSQNEILKKSVSLHDYSNLRNSERELLIAVSDIIDSFDGNGYNILGKSFFNFDLPLLLKRTVIHGLKINRYLYKQSTVKPWERSLQDLDEIWKFGSYNAKATLGAIASALGVTYPKEFYDGDKAQGSFWKAHQQGVEKWQEEMKNLEKYCENDVISTLEAYTKIHNSLY